MLIPITNIILTQNPTKDWPNRNSQFQLDFVHEFEVESTWETLTDTAKVTFPKNIYVTDKNGNPVTFQGVNKAIGGFTATAPLLMKGDQISITAGYKYYDQNYNVTIDVNPIFQGYITKVGTKIPIEIECEDNMWKLKQLTCPNQAWPGSQYTAESIMTQLLQGTGFTVNALTSTNVGTIRTNNVTVAELLQAFRKDYHLEAYFRGTELRIGSLVYVPADMHQQTFIFQQNIISDDLQWIRTDDLKLGANVYSILNNKITTNNKNGTGKTKTSRLETFVGQKGGEVRTLYFWNVTSISDLQAKGSAELQKYYYSGFKGEFTTFIVPWVQHGDQAIIQDNVLPERNGTYFIKKVVYRGGVNGHRQVITLDRKVA